jgi:hypothetical protein
VKGSDIEILKCFVLPKQQNKSNGDIVFKAARTERCRFHEKVKMPLALAIKASFNLNNYKRDACGHLAQMKCSERKNSLPLETFERLCLK